MDVYSGARRLLILIGHAEIMDNAHEMRALVAVVVAGMLAASAGAASPQRVAFAGTQTGHWAIYTADQDGSGLEKLTPGAGAFDSEPTWSPDGKRIGYVCRNFELCVMNADGSNKHRITTTDWPKTWTYYLDPAWSPDGNWIAFSSNLSGNYDLFVIRPDGSGEKRLTTGPRDESEPAWSHDGTRIAYASDANGLGDIYVMNASGSNQRRVTRTKDDEEAPTWSPDDKRIAYDRELDKQQNDLFVVSVDGSGTTRVTKTADSEGDADWSPDGSEILHETDKDGRLHAVRPDGTGTRTLGTPQHGIVGVWQRQGGPAGPPAKGPPPGRADANARFVANILEYSAGSVGTAEGSDTPAGMRRDAKRFRTEAARIRAAVANPPSARAREIRRHMLVFATGVTRAAPLLSALADAVQHKRQAQAQKVAFQLVTLIQIALNEGARAMGGTGFWKTGTYWLLSSQL